MPLVCLGLSHQTAPVEVRERHAFPPSMMAEALIALRDYEAVREAAMLSTCGRLEIYAELEDYEAGVEQIKAFLHNFRHGDVGTTWTSYLYTLLGRAGDRTSLPRCDGPRLDADRRSRDSRTSQRSRTFKPNRRTRSASRCTRSSAKRSTPARKRARSTGIGGESVSVATAAIDLAKAHLGNLAGKTVLVVGAGKMGATAAKRLRLEGCTELLIANRSRVRARKVIDSLGTGTAIELPVLGDALRRADIVVTSTGAPHFLLDPASVAAAMRARPERPLFIVDIAVPRDVDPEVAGIPGVSIADIDALKGRGRSDPRDTVATAIPLVEEIIGEHVERYSRWYQARVAVPVVASLVQKAETIREAELERLFAAVRI